MELIKQAYSRDPAVLVGETGSFFHYIENYRFSPDDIVDDPVVFLSLCQPRIVELLQSRASRNHAVIFWSSLATTMHKLDGSESSGYFSHKRAYIFPTLDINQQLNPLMARILKALEEYQEKGSGWMVQTVDYLEVHISPYLPLRGSSYAFTSGSVVQARHHKHQEQRQRVLPLGGSWSPLSSDPGS